jgi:hypothetical protein
MAELTRLAREVRKFAAELRGLRDVTVEIDGERVSLDDLAEGRATPAPAESDR